MKIIGFSSGAVGRESNADGMVKAVLDKCGGQTEFVKLTDVTFSGCKGCVNLCAGPQTCMWQDDLLPYYRKIKDADAVVLGSPVYFGTINATMISFIERFFGYRHAKNTIKAKPFILITCGGETGSDTVKENFQNMLEPFEVNILQSLHYKSGIPPCFSCGRHKKCTIGGLYKTIGKAAHSMDISAAQFRTWESHPKLIAQIESAAGQLRRI